MARRYRSPHDSHQSGHRELSLSLRRDHNAVVAPDIPLIARELELSTAVGVVQAAAHGHGGGILVTGEAGIGKTRLLREVRAEAERQGLPVLRGRAVESGGAYRPLVEAFTRPALALVGQPDLAGIRPILGHVLPGWMSQDPVLAPMADPAAVLAEALIVLLDCLAPNGAVLLLDDLHWADPDTVSVLLSLADSLDTIPLALVLAARTEPHALSAVHQLSTQPSIRPLALRRLTSAEVEEALHALHVPQLEDAQIDRIVAVVDGLPLVMDEFVLQVRDTGLQGGKLDLTHSSLASAVRLRLDRLSNDSRLVMDALSVIGDAEPRVLSAATGLDQSRVGQGLRDGLASTLLISAPTVLGVAWRHQLIRDAVRAVLVPLEQQAIAVAAADQLVIGAAPTDGELHQAARLYELAGHQHQAAAQLVQAARLAVSHAALDVAQQYLADARGLTGDLGSAAREVLIERIETLVVAGRAADGYESGVEAIQNSVGSDDRALVVATARAAYAAGYYEPAARFVARLERESESVDCQLALLRAQAALADRSSDAIELAEDAAKRAEEEGRTDIGCEALVIAGIAARRADSERVERLLSAAAEHSQRHHLQVWEVRALAERAVLDLVADSDASRLEQARNLAMTAGMVGTVAEIDMRIGEAIVVQQGFVASYPTFLRAYTSARQLRLSSLQTRCYSHLIECALMADLPLPGTTRAPGPSDVEAVVAEDKRLAAQARIPSGYTLGIRAWSQGDSATSIRTIEEGLHIVEGEVKIMPWWGFCKLLRVIDGRDPAEAFGPSELTGHHANWAARAYGAAVWELRAGRSADIAIAEAEHHLRHAPFWLHVLRTAVAPVAFECGLATAEGWLREADAFFDAAGERALQRRVRHLLGTIGAKIPRNSGSVAPDLARLGITAREVEILQLVNAGLSNADIAARLFISTRTVETHVSSLLRKSGTASRDELPAVADGSPC